MIGARAAQGLGAALMTPAALAITMTMTTYAGAQRAKALAMWGAVGGLGIAVVAFLHAGPAQRPSPCGVRSVAWESPSSPSFMPAQRATGQARMDLR